MERSTSYVDRLLHYQEQTVLMPRRNGGNEH